MKTLLQRFKVWRESRKALSSRKRVEKISGFTGQRRDDLIAIVSDKKFSLFLEYLELTISDKLVTLSSIDLLDDDMRKQAIKLQHQMRGLQLARDIAEDLVERAKGAASQTNQEDERID